MGTFYNSRALEWFECGRSEWIRNRLGLSYADIEARGVFLPLVEAHLEFRGGARYDDELAVSTSVDLPSPARLRFNVQICHHATAKPVVRGYTIHAFIDATHKPIRPPEWFMALIGKAA
jgi:acyl-CoA thioester hydrolase